MRELTAAEVSIAAGTTEDTVARLAELGVVQTGEQGFRPSDVRRVRLVLALETSGISFEAIGEAVRDGRISFDFIDELAPDPIPLLPETQRELVERLGLSRELARGLATILGTSALPADEQVRSDHAELFEVVAAAKAEGAPDELLVRLTRVTAENLRRVIEAQRDFIDTLLMEPLAAKGATPGELLAATATQRGRYRELGRRAVALLIERFADEAVFQNVVEQMELALGDDRVERQGESAAIAFLDMSGYTRLAEEAGDAEAASEAARFIAVVEAAATDAGGRLVKVLGDGVMLHFASAAAAVRAALNALRRVHEGGLPAVRAGINAGPMVRRDGDYFGSVVNLAARAADYARAHEILVTQEVVDGWSGDGSVHFRAIGAVSLKNVKRPVELFQVLPADV
ncbi:MAG TPA: adenylate/guanylate cyclase domain-containing protein [Gaiellaceae bacterium]|nr:adenylate/guanylate cyclase domain-containing protein [Gaiellaceae bacterium]